MSEVMECSVCERGEINDPRFPTYRRCACLECGGLGRVVDSQDFVERVIRLRQYWEKYEPPTMPHPQLAGVRSKALSAYVRELSELYSLYGDGLLCYAARVVHSDELTKCAIRLRQLAHEEAERLRRLPFAAAQVLEVPLRTASVQAVLGNLEEAEVGYRAAIERYPDNADTQHSYGIFLAMFCGRAQDALLHFLTASKLVPSAVHLLSVAKCYYETGDAHSAHWYLSRVINSPDFSTLDPSDQQMACQALQEYWSQSN